MRKGELKSALSVCQIVYPILTSMRRTANTDTFIRIVTLNLSRNVMVLFHVALDRPSN